MSTQRPGRPAAVWAVHPPPHATSGHDDAAQPPPAIARLASEAVRAEKGRIVSGPSGGILAVFESADAALRAALSLQAASSGSPLTEMTGAVPGIGIHAGDVAGSSGGEPPADVLRVVTRLGTAAGPGDVVVTEPIYRDIRHRREWEATSLGTRSIEGVPAPLALWRVSARSGYGALKGSPSLGSARGHIERALGDHFRLQGLLGEGGFAEVFRARDLRLKRDVAVKVLRPDLSSDPALVRRFYREGQAVARLRHPNVVPIFAVEEADGLAYFVMPYVEGETLEELLERENRLDYEEGIRILVEAAGALHAAHEQGIVHRDVKPDNILLEGGERRVLLSDFGIAKALEGETTSITGTHVVVGTPHYMSPEQASGGEAIDHRSDIYSLGVIGFRLFAGRLPFDGTSSRALMAQHVAVPVPNLRALASGVPAEAVEAVLRCLDKDPGGRWDTAADFARALTSTTGLPSRSVPAVEGAPELAEAVLDRSCLVFLGTGVRIGSDDARSTSSTAGAAITLGDQDSYLPTTSPPDGRDPTRLSNS